MVSGTLGGKFTTIEGLMRCMLSQLETSSACVVGDGEEQDRRTNLKSWLERFTEMLHGEVPFTLTLDDPMGNCYISDFSPLDFNDTTSSSVSADGEGGSSSIRIE